MKHKLKFPFQNTVIYREKYSDTDVWYDIVYVKPTMDQIGTFHTHTLMYKELKPYRATLNLTHTFTYNVLCFSCVSVFMKDLRVYTSIYSVFQ